MYVLQRIPVAHYLCALGLVLAGLLHPVQVAHAFQWPGAASGGTTTYGGTTVGPGNVGGTTFPHTPSGPVYASAGGKVYLPGGKVLDVTGRAPLSPAAYGRAIARAAGRLAPAAVAGAAIWGLLDDLGFIRDADGIKRADPAVCTVEPCYAYQTLNHSTGSVLQTFASFDQACADRTNFYQQGGSCVAGATNFWNYVLPGGYTYTSIIRRVSTAPAAEPSYLPSSVDELADAIASESGWPSGSSIGDAIREAIEQGETLPVPQPTQITGPATAPGPSVTTQKTTTDAQGNPTGVTNVTNNTTYHFNYGPNTVTTTTVTTTNTTNPDGTTETTTEEEQEEEPRDPCEDKPDALSCAELDTPEGEVPREDKTITYAPEEMGLGAGSCPADLTMSVMSRGGQSMKVWDWAQTCAKITTYVRPLVLTLASITALFLVVGYKPGGDTDGAPA
jgi:hypothetical protein